MPSIASILGTALIALVSFVLLMKARTVFLRRRARRDWVSHSPFPEAWRSILRRNMAAYRRMPSEVRGRLERKVMAFLADKNFEACGGLRRVTDEMAVTIAGHACLLVLPRAGETVYPGLSTVLVYPDSFFSGAAVRAAGPEGARDDSGEHRVGESDSRGAVVLSWMEVRNNVALSGNGRNVILHEFAHQLDAEDSVMDGAPRVAGADERDAWRRDLLAAYEVLRRDGEHGVLDPYGGREPAELFAVAVEAFFEDAPAFRENHPVLHAHFARHFGVDPSRW